MPSKKAPVLSRPLLDQRGAAEYMGFTPRQLRRWIEERRFTVQVVKVFGRNYYHPDDLDRFVANLPRQVPAHDLIPAPPNGRRKRGRR